MLSVEEWTQELDTTFIANRTQLLRAAYKILGDWERSDDVVQEAYIKITEMEAAQKVRQPLAYLFQIVRNLAIDHYRRVVFESELFGTDEEGLHRFQL
ncbi:sigma factor [Nitrosomonas sp. Nm33]|uniref:sigma factor n=1 Tax=Nitrosomonas sp. Nm33 TaxID=133724 RepID=UPI0008982692|nr:sigma factor [Nitrosomonas sp. Nm33]SDY87407.1 RNA polymerase sigma-70 factor, ECF subfamily [Nitrosomonas sp. Nm33]